MAAVLVASGSTFGSSPPLAIVQHQFSPATCTHDLVPTEVLRGAASSPEIDGTYYLGIPNTTFRFVTILVS
jgi:hypothetical protein